MEEPSDDSIDSPEAPSAEAVDQMILLRANMMREVQNEVINNILINNYYLLVLSNIGQNLNTVYEYAPPSQLTL